MPMPEKANSVILVLPMITAPAARSRATIGGVGHGRRRILGEDLRAGAGRLAGDIEQILDLTTVPASGPSDIAARGAGVGGIGRGASSVGIDRKKARAPSPVGSAMRASACSSRSRQEKRLIGALAAGFDLEYIPVISSEERHGAQCTGLKG